MEQGDEQEEDTRGITTPLEWGLPEGWPLDPSKLTGNRPTINTNDGR